MSHSRSSALRRLLLCRSNELLAILSIAFILQAGLVPFDFEWGGLESARRAIEAASGPSSPLHDIVGNVFLFIPFGVFVAASLTVGGDRSFWFFLTLLGAALLSGGLEWIQAFSPSRISSIIDVAANVVGAGIGATLSVVGRSVVPGLIGAAMFEFRKRPTVAVLKGYVLSLFVLGAMPFTFAFDAPRFKQAIRQTVLIPFGNPIGESNVEAATETRDSDLRALATSRRWSRWAAEAASFVLLAWLFQIVLRGEFAFTSRGAIGLTWWLAGLQAIGLSLGQFLVITRGLDVTDVCFRLLGIALGVASWESVRRFAFSSSMVWFPCRAGTCCVAIWITLVGLAPFRFSRPHEEALSQLSAASFMPFMAYFETRVDVMLTDVLEKVISYALLAASMVGGWSSFRGRSSGRRLILVTAIGVALAAAIEAAQLLLPVRVVSLTDLVLAAVGCLLGVMFAEHVAAFVEFVRTHRVLGPGERPRSLPPLVAVGPVEQLMSTLGDPYDAAPREPTPTRRDASAN